MKKTAVFVALLALSFYVQARPVSQGEVSHAAVVWARTGMVRTTGNDARIERVSALQSEAKVGFFAAKLAGGGTVFMSGDTECRPVIAFVASTNDFSAIEPASPLWALLNRDQGVVSSARNVLASGSSPSADALAAEREWQALLDAPVYESSAADPLSPLKQHVSSLSDVRAGPLMGSTWDQSTVAGDRCYNYYTPVLSDGSHAVCGCVATAMAQLMRYHRYPRQSVNQVTRKCYVQASTKSQSEATVNLTTQGGTYDWANMPLKPGSGITTAERQAIGKLTSDAGISVYMSYDTTGHGGSGAFMFNASVALRNVFGYASACIFSADEITARQTDMRNAMLSNLDAGYPVLMGIAGNSGGHAIVGDGYGYKDGKLYVHLNMGWSGTADVWYNLPYIDCATGSSFSIFDDLVYNIFPKSTGGLATLSGRVVDDEGNGTKDLLVTIRPSGEESPVATDRTTNGVFGVRVEPGTYDIEVQSADGRMKETQEGVVVSGTTTTTKNMTGWINQGRNWYETYHNVPVVVSVGNLQQKQEIVLYQPTVRIGADRQYSRLDKALKDAKNIYLENPGEPVVVEVIDETDLEVSCEIDFPCVLTSLDPAGMSVYRVKDAKLNVTKDGQLVASNIVFAASSSTLFDVAAGGRLTLGANVALGVPNKTAAVRTQQSDGFLLSGEPLEWFAVDCTAARGVGEVFGYADGDHATVAVWAAKFVNLNDPNGELAGSPVIGETSPYALEWKLLPVPIEDATAYYVVDGQPDVTNCFRRLDRLFELFETVTSPATVTIVKNGSLTRTITPASDLTVVSPNGSVVSNLTATTGFVITNGIRLAVAGVCFDGSGPNQVEALFLVNGGELEIGGNVSIRNVKGANAVSSGAVSILSGSAKIGSEDGRVTFEGCQNTHDKSRGGAVYAKGRDCALTLRNRVTIEGCNARLNGGAIYLGVGSCMDVSGYLTVTGNTARADGSLADDVYCDRCADEAHVLFLSGKLETGSRIGVRSYEYALDRAGGQFAAVAPGLTDKAAIQKSVEAFVSNKDATLYAELNASSGSLQWVLPPAGIRPVDLDAAVACVVNDDGSLVGYASVEDAIGVLENGGVVMVLRNAELTKDVEVKGSVLLTSSNDCAFVVTRAAQCQVTIGENASLTLKNVTLSGRLDEERGGNGQLLNVVKGSLTFDEGSVLCNVSGGMVRAGAVKVYRGRVSLLKGSEIRDCDNAQPVDAPSSGCGGAITADSLSVVSLQGGVIKGCAANEGGAVFIGNETTVEISGDFTAVENMYPVALPNNVCVAIDSLLVLAGKLTGRVGYRPGVGADPYVFGKVSDGFVGSDADIAESAHRFSHDLNGDVGIAVRNGSETLLVWSDGLDAQGNYVTAKGETYVPVAGGSSLTAVMPEAVEGLVYTGEEQVGVVAGHGYVIEGECATDAGTHEATLTLKAGFAWEDGQTARVRTIQWKIAQVSLVVKADAKTKVKGASDPELTYAVEGLCGKDTRESVLTGSLARVEGEEPGTYDITCGTLEVVGPNYILEYVGATFTITNDTPGPGPGPGPQPVTIEPLAFSSIEKTACEWVLVATNATQGCEYSLRSGTTLQTNTWAETSWTLWTKPTGAITNRVPTVDGEPARFWILLGRPAQTQE